MSNGFAHIELNTDDPAKAQKFYKAVFPGWKLSAVPGAKYVMIDTGAKKDAAGGGIQEKPMPEAPTQWLPYVQVDDVKQTAEKARKAGGQIAVEYMEIGGDMGAIGVFIDPTGAAIGVWETSKKPARKKAAPKKAAKKAKATPKKAAPRKAAKKTKKR